MYKLFMTIMIAQLFYSFGVTIITYAIQPFNVDTSLLSEYQNSTMSMSNVTSKIEEVTKSQLNIPLIDLGALVFYSGNIVVDLMLNFFFALPSIMSLIVGAFTTFFNLDAYLASMLKLFIYTVVTLIYFWYLIAFILSIRSRGTIV